MLLLLPLLLLVSPPADPPAEAAVPPWEREDNQLPELAGDLDFLARLLPQHAQNWAKYRELQMTPVDDADGFRQTLERALRRGTEHLPQLPKDEAGHYIRPIPAFPAAAPEGPMTDELFTKLAGAVQDQLLFMQDRPFEYQRHRFLAGRRVSLEYPDREYNAAEAVGEVVERLLEENLDVAALDEAGQWKLLERFYEQRRASAGGGHCVTGAALDSRMGLRAGVYFSDKTGELVRVGLRFDEATRRYWYGNLVACGLLMTWPARSEGQIIEQEGRLLRAEVLLVVETASGDRAPLRIIAYFDPADGEGGEWQISSCCFTSSPFAAAAEWVR